MSVASDVGNAETPADSSDEVSLSSVAGNISIVEQGLRDVVTDIDKGLSSDVLTALGELREGGCPKFLSLRVAFKKANSDIRLGDLDRMVQAARPDALGQDDSLPGAVENIVAMVQGLGELFQSTDDEPYIRFPVDGHFETWALQSTVFKEWVAHEYYKTYGRAAKAQQLNDAFTTLAGCARHEGDTHDVHLRVAPKDNGYLLDMSDDQWRVIRMTSAGYEILNQSPVRFKRPKGSKALFQPQPGTLEDLRALVNVSEDDEPLLVAALCESFRPNTAYPVIEFGGEQGSGKSVTQNHIRRLIDPKDISLRAEPKCVADIFISARNNHIVSYNNLSHLSADFQDALCCLATGGGYASRRLYTDGDEATFDAKRFVMMNGIVGLATQPDLLSRVLLYRTLFQQVFPNSKHAVCGVIYRFETDIGLMWEKKSALVIHVTVGQWA